MPIIEDVFNRRNRVKTPTNSWRHLSEFPFLFEIPVHFLLNVMTSGGKQDRKGLFSFMCSCWWVYDRTVLLCCCRVSAPAGLTLLVWRFPAAQNCVEPRGDTEGVGGGRGGHMPGSCIQSWAILSYRSTADASFGHPSVPSLSDTSQQMFSLLSNKSQVLILHITEQVNTMPQGQNGHFCNPFSAKLYADITIYHPPAHTMFRCEHLHDRDVIYHCCNVFSLLYPDAMHNDKEIGDKVLSIFPIFSVW